MQKEEKILREAIRNMLKNLILEKGKGKPGGGLTDLGAWRRISPLKWSSQISSAIDAAGGDIEKTADRLGVSGRTVYAALEDEPALQRAKDDADKESDGEDEKKKYGKDTKPSSSTAK